MPGPGVYNFDLYQGDYWEQDFDLAVDTGTEAAPNVSPYVLTGCTVSASIKKKAKDVDALAQIEASVLDELAGRVRLLLTNAESRSVTSNGVWDLQVTDAQGRTSTWLVGTVTLTRDVTAP